MAKPPLPPDAELSFLDHLDELRTRLLRVVMFFFVAFLIGYGVAPWGLELLVRPMARAQATALAAQPHPTIPIVVAEDGTLRLDTTVDPAALAEARRITFSTTTGMTLATYEAPTPPPLLYLRPIDPFLVRLKAAFVLAAILTMPMLLSQTWGFVAPGLLPHERQLALPLILSGSLLFPLGALFAYFLLEAALLFLSTFVMDYAVVFNDAQAYLGFVLTMMLAFGIVFEFPLGVILLTRTGLITTAWLAAHRRHVFVGLLVAAAIATPTGDPITLAALALPLYALFEGALVVSRILDRRALAEAREIPPTDSEAPTA